MKYNNPLEIANITTDVLADYLYKAISDLDSEDLVKFDNADYIKDYLDNTIDLLGTDNFYTNVLNSYYGRNHSFGTDFFETQQQLKKYVCDANLYLINDSLAVNDTSNDYVACDYVLEMLEADRNDSDE
ncbi:MULTISPECIES: hypothetical protein [Enterobacterales]|uniref:Uncharacterized protein n=2 Tax=Salmonella typhi TaxID=90370 RepID=A0A1L4BLR5_SALTI|nr:MULTISPECIES: hypothetical protein [Enterobacterales]EAP7385705.1 hypothetical protein [Salmonella enterica]ECH7576276.1 hypothetical protein [Salmonella enterica subsp. enterica serovar Newport]EDI0965233.1 hypothetical protein [Salmonella enterica subsp. enterica serovar Mbandaka]EDO4183418.1 hypothetical protein [Salmonella enterica subsp. enterica serovar Infantis]EEE9973881.1 hypothetical protein [Salmonella enterica subsp. enterica serovar Enteritidis]EGT5763783.1 hypothetical protei